MTVRLGQAIGVFVVLVIAVDLSAQQGAPETGEWPTYSGDLGGTKYSPLDQIDADNFGTLEIAWHWQSADAVLSVEMPGGGEWRTNSSLIFDELSPSWAGPEGKSGNVFWSEFDSHVMR